MSAVAVPALLITKAFVVWTFVAVMIKLPVTAKFETERYSIFAEPGTYKFESVARFFTDKFPSPVYETFAVAPAIPEEIK